MAQLRRAMIQAQSCSAAAVIATGLITTRHPKQIENKIRLLKETRSIKAGLLPDGSGRLDFHFRAGALPVHATDATDSPAEAEVIVIAGYRRPQPHWTPHERADFQGAMNEAQSDRAPDIVATGLVKTKDRRQIENKLQLLRRSNSIQIDLLPNCRRSYRIADP
eukprot:GHVT01025731.1.p1 GENE.GHVT01025731.1~~GHVT01025731.1.p1  ORF type:complete len:171 (+),score=25.20 GHVT01025731.1:24-515(+)